jgi:carboxypeptidase Taq
VTYRNLEQHFRRISHFEELAAIVSWDEAVNMPPQAGPRRADALASLTRLVHDLTCDPQVNEWVIGAQEESDLDDWQRANVAEISKRHTRATALPADLVEATAQACSLSEQAWRRYRAENDFKSFAPFLKTVVERKRSSAQALSETLGLSPYDSLMDGFEPGMNSAIVNHALAPLREFLPTYIDEVIERQKSETVIEPFGPFPVAEQQKLAQRMMIASGLDMERARIDKSHHPFCGGVPSDVRITTRYSEEQFLPGLMGVLHESGHGKYEQGLPEEYRSQPVGTALGMTVHEGQSLLQEMQVSRGRDFISFLASQFGIFFPEQVRTQPQAYTVENLVRLQTRVKKGFIRVDADEVTYPAHILLRYELEADLVAGKLEVLDIPEAWDQKMQLYLGLSTKGNVRDGCLQDVHWPVGAFGYFPMYTLGAMVAAQLFSAAQSSLSDLPSQIRTGDLSSLNAWLKERVWSKGRSLSFDELMRQASGETLNPEFFVKHLHNRYG